MPSTDANAPPLHRAPSGPGNAHPPAAGDGSSVALSPIELALERTFQVLDRAGIPVLALRGARNAPLYRHGGDLDLACLARHRRAVRRVLTEQLARTGVVLVSEHDAPSMVQLQLYAACGPGHHHHLCVDLHTRETCYGVPFLKASELLALRSDDRLPLRPGAVPSALLDFLTPFLSGGYVHPEYAARLEFTADQNPVLLRSTLGGLVGTRRADRLLAALRDEHPTAALAREAKPLRRALLARAFARRPFASIVGFLGQIWSARVRPFFRPRGMTVALLGTDGTGKTTLGERLLDELKPSFRSAANRIVKLRPGLLPQLGRFVGRKPTAEEYARPHRATPSGTLGTWLRATYYWIDYWAGYVVRTLPLRRRNTLILFDRWVDDWLVDPARYRMRPGSRYVRFLARLTPRPDVTLVTTAPLRVVRARKQEVDARESLRQLQGYEELAAERTDTFIVSTAGAVDDAVDSALHALFYRVQPIVPGLVRETPNEERGRAPRRAA